jgi:hypothetical protein
MPNNSSTILHALVLGRNALQHAIASLTFAQEALKAAMALPLDLMVLRHHHLDLREQGTEVAELVFLYHECVEQVLLCREVSDSDGLVGLCAHTAVHMKSTESELGYLDIEVGELLARRAWTEMFA